MGWPWPFSLAAHPRLADEELKASTASLLLREAGREGIFLSDDAFNTASLSST